MEEGRSTFVLESQVLSQLNSRNIHAVKYGPKAMRKIVENCWVVAKKIGQRVIDPDCQLSRKKREVLFNRQKDMIDKFLSEADKIDMAMNDYQCQSLVFAMDRIGLLSKIATFLQPTESILTGQQYKLKQRISGFAKKLIKCLHGKDIKTKNGSDDDDDDDDVSSAVSRRKQHKKKNNKKPEIASNLEEGGMLLELVTGEDEKILLQTNEICWQMHSMISECIAFQNIPSPDRLSRVFYFIFLKSSMKNIDEDVSVSVASTKNSESFNGSSKAVSINILFIPSKIKYQMLVLVNSLLLVEVLCKRVSLHLKALENADSGPQNDGLSEKASVNMSISYSTQALIISFRQLPFCNDSKEKIILLKVTMRSLKSLMSTPQALKRPDKHPSNFWSSEIHTFSDIHLAYHLIYWLNEVLQIRSKAVYTYSSDRFRFSPEITTLVNNEIFREFEEIDHYGNNFEALDLCDINIGSIIVVDILICCSNQILTLCELIHLSILRKMNININSKPKDDITRTKQSTETPMPIISFSDLNQAEQFPLLKQLILGSVSLSCMTICHYAHLLGATTSGEPLVDEELISKERDELEIKKMRKKMAMQKQQEQDDRNDSTKTMHSFAQGDAKLIQDADEEVVAAFGVISASFSSGLITTAAVEALVAGRELSISRKASHSIQISWLQAMTSAVLTVLNNGQVCEVEDNRKSASPQPTLQVQNERDEDNPKQDIPWQFVAPFPPVKALFRLFKSAIVEILALMTYHRQSLSIQQAGILLLRLIVQEPFMKRSEIEEFVSGQANDSDDDGGGGDDGDDDNNNSTLEDDGTDDGFDLSSLLPSISSSSRSNPNNRIKKKKKKSPAQMFLYWHREVSLYELEQLHILPSNSFTVPEILAFDGENHIQSVEVLEQLLLFVYQLSTSSHLAKVSLIDADLHRVIERILELQSDNTYIVALSELCLDEMPES